MNFQRKGKGQSSHCPPYLTIVIACKEVLRPHDPSKKPIDVGVVIQK